MNGANKLNDRTANASMQSAKMAIAAIVQRFFWDPRTTAASKGLLKVFISSASEDDDHKKNGRSAVNKNRRGTPVFKYPAVYLKNSYRVPRPFSRAPL
jgi:hypothetical protein